MTIDGNCPSDQVAKQARDAGLHHKVTKRRDPGSNLGCVLFGNKDSEAGFPEFRRRYVVSGACFSHRTRDSTISLQWTCSNQKEGLCKDLGPQFLVVEEDSRIKVEPHRSLRVESSNERATGGEEGVYSKQSIATLVRKWSSNPPDRSHFNCF